MRLGHDTQGRVSELALVYWCVTWHGQRRMYRELRAIGHTPHRPQHMP